MANFVYKTRYNIFLWILIIIIVTGAFLAGRYLSNYRVIQNKLPVKGMIPAYTLTNQLGNKVSSKDFKGKIRIVTFLFPYCKEYCPLIAINMVNLEQLLKSAHLTKQVQLIAYNVDPGDTGPTQMSAFMTQYGWNPNNTNWEYLTGSPKTIRNIVRRSFYISYQKVSEATEDSLINMEKKKGIYVPSPEVRNKLAEKVKPEYDIAHNDALVIADKKGRIRKIYDDADHVSNQRILNVINQLLQIK
jgi:protein SCO1/2